MAIPVALAIAAAAGVLGATEPRGPGITSDSVHYISISRQLACGHGFRWGCSANPCALWPPGYPAALAGAAALGVAPDAAARWINAIAMAAIVLVSAAFVYRHSRSMLAAVAAAWLIYASAMLLETACYALSDTAFILAVMVFLYFADTLLKDLSPGPLAALACAITAAFMLRYMSVVLPLVAVLLLLINRRQPWSVKLRRGGVFLAGSCAIPAAWLVRNYVLTGTLTGPRPPAAATLGENFLDAGATLARGFLPGNGSSYISAEAAMAVFLALVAALPVAGILMRRRLSGPDDSPGAPASVGASLLPAYLLTIVYVVYVIAAASLAAVEPISTRYLAPVYPIVISATAIACGRMIAGLGLSRRGAVAVAAFVIASAGMFQIQSLYAAYIVNWSRQVGLGYNDQRYRQSPLLQYAAARADDGTMQASNYPELVWHVTGQPCINLPRRSGYRSRNDIRTASLDDFGHALDRFGTLRVIWVEPAPEDFMPVAELAGYVKLDLQACLSDGAVYRASKRTQARPN